MFILAAICMKLAGAANAQTVTVADVEALPGETVAFALNLQDGQADTYTSLQFNIQFPADGFTTTGDYTISSAWKNASATVGDVDATGLAVVPVSSAEVITGSDVDNLLMVSFTVGSGVELGDYDVTLSDITFGYGFTDKDVAPDLTFTVNVVSTHTVVLDENATAAPEAAEGVNVRVLRTITAGNWSSICLPFAMTEAQCKAAFGEDVHIADFTGAEVDDEENIQVNFSSVSAMEANHPYIIKVGSDVTEFTVDNVDISPEDEPALDRNEETTGTGRNKKTTYNSFIGTYVAETVVPDYALFLSGNKFWFSTGSTVMKAFRAYFDLATAGAEYRTLEAANIHLSVADDETSDIGRIASPVPQAGSTIYDLQGRPAQTPAHGLYVKDGKKVIVK